MLTRVQLVPNLLRTLDWVSQEFGLTVHQAAHRMVINEDALTVTIDGRSTNIPDHCLDEFGSNYRWLCRNRVRLAPFPAHADVDDPLFPDAS